MLPRALPLLIGLLALVGCSEPPEHPLYQPSAEPFKSTGYRSFAAYQSETRQWLNKNRVILGPDKEAEIEINMPFSVRPVPSAGQGKRKGILLVHGLGDSPWSFRDLADEFAKEGYLVRTLLLAGHGSRPADMLSIDDSDWEALVREQVAIIKQEVDEVSLGGFSTGANLVTSYAIDDSEIRSLFLFSPAFQSDQQFDFMTPLAAFFKDWLFTPNPEKLDNPARYGTVPLNGFAQYYKTSSTVQKQIEAFGFDRPVFIATTAADSVVDVSNTLALFENHFTHQGSRLVWFGDAPDTSDTRVAHFSGHVPEFKISNFSHMGILFSPANRYYGVDSSYRMCHNGQSDAQRAQCEQGGPVWYSAWGYREDGKVHARLTFNPYFEQMIEQIRLVIHSH